MTSEPNLASMLRAQHGLQCESYKKDPMTLTGAELMEFVRWNAYALEDEIHEATGECGWKPWATSNHMNGTQFLKELVDAWHFFMNLMLAAAGQVDGLNTPEDVAHWFFYAYCDKHGVNAQRQADGYDGVSGKCPTCHRDYAESECRPGFCAYGQYQDEIVAGRGL